jgi:sterol desaturase/sphingolipid hydroxylase (fatty acid hydroxylase superfamily)
LLGVNEEALAMQTLFTVVVGVFQHANIDVRLGPLNRLFSLSEVHRWHHSKDVREANHNYGSNLTIWDVVFGTWYLPARRPPIDLGIGDMPGFPKGYLDQLMVPFRWRTLRHRVNAGARSSLLIP